MKKLAFLKENLINPATGESCCSFNGSEVVFKCKTKFSAFKSKPIIIDESISLFKIEDVLNKIPTAQNSKYRNKSFKNIVRKKILPSLSKDFKQIRRYNKLACDPNIKNVLVIGAGDKVDFYNSLFKNALVITSDVHLLFSPDLIFDAHKIPFKDAIFDLVITSQVLEHTFQPWKVASELERVVKLNGYLLIETPFNFPYHSPPYDFYRFTFTGLRSLFPKCKISSFEASEGSASAVATFMAQFLIDVFSNRYLRIMMLFFSRFLFGWIKYLDLLKSNTNYLSILSPMGFSMIFKRDEIKRTNIELLDEFYKLKSKK